MTWRSLPDAMVAAYRPYLMKVSAAHAIDDAVAAGERWLAAELAKLAATPFVNQRRAPLEVYQESMRFPTAALEALGVAPPRRDAVAAAVLPGDTYGLAPASTQDLGSEVWEAHLAWGAAKAAATRTVAWFGRDLADRSRIEAAAAAASLSLAVSPPGLLVCRRVVVDLEYEGGLDVLTRALDLELPSVGYGPHKATTLLAAAEAAGATVVPRSVFFRELVSLLDGDPGETEETAGEAG